MLTFPLNLDRKFETLDPCIGNMIDHLGITVSDKLKCEAHITNSGKKFMNQLQCSKHRLALNTKKVPACVNDLLKVRKSDYKYAYFIETKTTTFGLNSWQYMSTKL